MHLDPVLVPSPEDELARQWLAQRHRQVRPARPASAVVLVRDGVDGVEVLLRHRTGRTPLGRIGFPGGALVESDADAGRWFGPEPGEWARVLGIVDRRRARQHVVAAVRELFEESGVLLAGHSAEEITVDARGETWGGHRSSLERGDASLSHLLAERGLGVRTDLLRPLARWLSAEHSPRRFDAVVFAAALPPQQTTVARADAPAQQAWVTASRVLSEPSPLPGPPGWLGERGMVEMEQVATPMTLCILRQLARHRTAAGFLLSLSAGREAVPSYRVRTAPDGAHTDCIWAVPERVDEG